MYNRGRPTSYKPEYVKKVNEYLTERQDEDVNFDLEPQGHGGALLRNRRVRVKLPTIEGFARFLGVNKTTLYEWAQAHPEFSNALDKIRAEQHDWLINNGLSGEYNPTIAKLVLSSNHGYAEKNATEHSGAVDRRIIYLPQRERMETPPRKTD